jgi:glucose/mannose-6-phosphate isomerase
LYAQEKIMQELIQSFTSHLKEAVQIGQATEFNHPDKKFDNILICGLGGSGIGGTIIQLYLQPELSIPVLTNKAYQIPAFVDEKTLVICSSYSGNTEETLAMYEESIDRGAEVAIVSSGGKFIEKAQSSDHNFIKIPGGLPPRAAFGYSFPQLFYVLQKYGLIDTKFQQQLEQAIELIDSEESGIQEEARRIAGELVGKIPVIYCESSLEGIAVRFRQQINENGKMLCWHHVVPEMNHNELVGWRENYQERVVAVFLESEEDYYRNRKRFDYSKSVIEQYAKKPISIKAKGKNALSRQLYLIHICDWISYFIAEKKEIDAVEVEVISGLKNMLAELD